VPGEGLTGLCDNVMGAAVAQMISVRMGDDGGLHRLPRVDEKVTERAEEAATRYRNERFVSATHECTADVAQAMNAEIFVRKDSFPI
jgi:alkyl hydroperoxide reductase subunit AhpF